MTLSEFIQQQISGLLRDKPLPDSQIHFIKNLDSQIYEIYVIRISVSCKTCLRHKIIFMTFREYAATHVCLVC